ncbi:MAG: PAS domain S-box protein [Chloroflexi bacterium]|nr:PAS domain S-box protein [Chloroflexota bacterium]
MDDSCTVADVSRLLGVSPSTVRRRIRTHGIDVLRDASGALRIRRADVQRLTVSRQVRREDSDKSGSGEAMRVEREAWLRLALEQARAGVVDFEPSTGVLRWSEGVTRLLGLPSTAMPSLALARSLIHEDDVERLTTEVREAIARGGPIEVEYRIVRPDGAVRWIAGDAAIVPGQSGDLSVSGRILGLVTDITERKRIETALVISERRFRGLAEQSEDVFWITDSRRYRLLYVSPSYERVYGQTARHVYTDLTRFIDVVHPADRARVRAALAVVPAGPYTQEYRVLRPDGSIGWVRDRGFPVRDETGAIVYFAGTAEDISEQKRAEDRQRFLVAAGAALAGSLDEAEILHRVADLVASSFADWCTVDLVSPDDTIELAVVAHADPATVVWAREVRRRFQIHLTDERALARVIRTGMAAFQTQVEDRHLIAWAHNDDELRLLRAVAFRSMAVVPLAARGRVLGALGIATAESGRRFTRDDLQVAEELGRRLGLTLDNARLFRQAQEAEARYRDLFERSTDPIFVTDAHGRFLAANDAVVELLGYAREELRQLFEAGGTIAANPAESEQKMISLRESGRWRGEIELRRTDGTIVPVEAHVRRVDIPGGGIIVGTWRDVAERRALERMQHEFISIVTHELRNPLAALKGYAQLTRRRERYDERLIDMIVNQARQLERLIDDLQDVSRLDARRLAMERREINLVELARTSVEQAQAQTTEHQIRLATPAAPIVGNWDPDRLRQILHNLLSNAVKYSPDGGEIVVQVEAQRDDARVSIADRGLGIAPERMGQLFNRFYRVGTSARRVHGLGLGLHITRELVEAHGGRIWVESAGEGQGSTFRFTLPLS